MSAENLVASRVKIGRAKNPRQRLAALQTGRETRDLRIYATIETEDYVRLERTLHLRYRDRRCLGEWFDFGPDELSDLVADARLVAATL